MIKGCLSPIQTTSEQSRLSEWNHLLKAISLILYLNEIKARNIVPTNRLNQIT
jgi:hypothetical protein